MSERYFVLSAYFAVLFGLGVAASLRIRTLSDFYVGGKKMRYWVVAFSTQATGESGWLLLGLTGLGAMAGARALWVVFGEVAGVTVAWFLLARRFKRTTDGHGAITVPDYLVARFAGDGHGMRQSTLRALAAGAIALFVTIYVSAQIDATGKAVESFLGWNYHVGSIVGFGVVVAYCYAGGFVAAAWTDTFQGTLMLAGLVALPIAALSTAPSLPEIGTALEASSPGFTSLWGPGGAGVTNLLVIVSYIAIGLGFLGSPQIAVRFISARDVAEIDKARWVALAFTLLTDTGAVLTGMLGRYLLVPPHTPAEGVLGTGAETVLPALVVDLFPEAVVGLYVAAVLAAIMSTTSSLVVLASSAVTRDFYQKILRPDAHDDHLTGMSRRVTLALSILALAIALGAAHLAPGRTVFWFAIFGWSGIAATFCPVVTLALLWQGYTFAGAVTSMTIGFAAVPLFKFIVPELGELGRTVGLAGELAPAFLLSTLAGVLASLVSRGAPAAGR